MRKFSIDLISDTATRPSLQMLQAMFDAETGDEQRGEDPTTLYLCRRVADLMGMEEAVFLPSGTMCNQIAFLVHCRPGDEIIAAGNSHIVRSEGAGAAALAGAQILSVQTETGIFAASDVEPLIRASRDRSPVSRLISVEQTTNSGGGAVWQLDTLRELGALAKKHELGMHMDGARLMNAVVSSGHSAHDFCEGFDSAWIDLSKGLGCPVGAVLAGNAEFIRRAWVWKHRLGGAMRQSGVLAAAGVFALENNVERMAMDHENARLLADSIREIPNVQVSPSKIESNILFLEIEETGKNTSDISSIIASAGVRLNAESKTRFRAVTHSDISREQILLAAEALKMAFASVK